EAEYGHMRVWAITSQGLYRPGSSVPYTAFVRAAGSKTLTPAPDLDYTLSITDPKGNEIVDKEHVKLSEYGDFQGQVDIPESAPMGTYVIHLSWPVGNDGSRQSMAGEFKVTDFVPTQFKVGTLIAAEQLHP